jgi:hypothetical protein
MFVCRQQPPAVLGEDGHECGDVPLVPGAIVNGELSYRVYRHPAKVRRAAASLRVKALFNAIYRYLSLSTRLLY